MNMRYAMRSEDTEQINVVSWANWNVNRYPELKWLHHVPNGGSRNKQEAVKLKQMGSRRAFLIYASRTRKDCTADCTSR